MFKERIEIWNLIKMQQITQAKVFFLKFQLVSALYRKSGPEVFLEKGILKICSKFTVENTHAEVRF